jgi:hypothetical protein
VPLKIPDAAKNPYTLEQLLRWIRAHADMSNLKASIRQIFLSSSTAFNLQE